MSCWRRSSWRWIATFSAIFHAQAAHALTCDFTPATSTCTVSTASNVTRTSPVGYQITTPAPSGGTYEEGYIDIPFSTASDVIGRELILDALRVNYAQNSSFNADPTCTTLSSWTRSSSTDVTLGASTLDTNCSVRLTQNTSGSQVYVQQSYEIDPGELYRIRYAVDTTGLASGDTLEVRQRYLDSTGAALEPEEPEEPEESDTAVVIDTAGEYPDVPSTSPAKLYEKIAVHTNQSKIPQSQRVVMLDCDDHVIYQGDTADTGAIDQVTYDRQDATTTCMGDVYSGMLTFLLNSSTDVGSTVEVDSVNVDWDRQIEVAIFDAEDLTTPLQTSTLQFGVYVDPANFASVDTSTGVVVRVYLRTQRSSATPTLKRLLIQDFMKLDLSLGTPFADLPDPRMGVDMHLPPRSEFDDTTNFAATRSLCLDPVTSTMTGCYDVFADFGLLNARMFLNLSSLDWTGPEPYTPSLNATGDAWLQRIAEANAAGIDTLILFPIHGDGPSDMNIWTEVDSDSDGDTDYCTLNYGSGSLADDAQSEVLIEDGFTELAASLDGSHSTGAYADKFEIFNEPNLSTFSADCPSFLPDSELPRVMNDVADSILSGSGRSGLSISFSGLETGDGPVYDNAYLSGTLLADPYMDPASFTHANFHPYTKTRRPEEIMSYWPGAESLIAGWDSSWDQEQTWFTEFAYSLAVYDPNCMDNWFRSGLGEEEQAKMVALSTLSQLAIPVEEVLAWGQMSNEGQSHSTYLANPCWRSDPEQNKVLFERTSTDDVLSTGDTASPPAEYEPNSAGLAYLTLSQYLSTSTPFRVTSLTPNLPSGMGPVPGDERYYAVVLGADYNSGTSSYQRVVLALWWYKEYDYGYVRTDLGETTDLYYQNFLYGARRTEDDEAITDHPVRQAGFRERRIHGVRLHGLPSPGSVTGMSTVALDGSFTETTLHFSVVASDLWLDPIAFGEEPVLVVIDY